MEPLAELEIFSDFNCTWCYFDKPTIKKLTEAYALRVVWRAFPLHPDIPEGGLLIQELFGNNLPLMTDKMALLEQKADSLGLPLAKRTHISDSRLSQELAKWAETKGKLGAFQDAVYQAYFADGLDIARRPVLLDAAEAAGLSGGEALDVLETKRFSEAVDEDWERSEDLEIMVAPTYIMNGERLAGSQPYERLERLVRRARALPNQPMR